VHTFGYAVNSVQQTIYAKSYDGLLPLGLDVNVTSPLIKTVVEQVIYRIGYVLVTRRDLLVKFKSSPDSWPSGY